MGSGECTLEIGKAACHCPHYRCSVAHKGFQIALIHSLLHPAIAFSHPSTVKAPLPLVKSVEQTLRRPTPCLLPLSAGFNPHFTIRTEEIPRWLMNLHRCPTTTPRLNPSSTPKR